MEPLKLNVIVVGGGIAGLAAAVVLGRAGHDITVSCQLCAGVSANLLTRSWKSQVSSMRLGI